MAYDASYNSTFFARLINWAKVYQGVRDEGQRLQDSWNSLSVSGDPEFVETGGITTTEATALVTMLDNTRKFTENEAVSTGDRVATLAPFLSEE
jgi:hypothetical protein